ncbi:hypothetical protein L208DRAFT_1290935, partial [Tricholoma matsutake]
RDQSESYATYCRLMLLLFKPWWTVFDLCVHGQSWQDAFITFQHSSHCSLQISSIMNNMHLLHECKDSHNNHFSQCRA